MVLEIVVAGYVVMDDKVLLIDHKKLDKFLPVGGHIEPNETPDNALRRESLEEISQEVSFLQYPESRRGNKNEYALPFYVNVHPIGDSHEHYCLFYLCSLKSKKIRINNKELNGYGWFSREELENPRIPDSVKITSLEAIRLAKGLSVS